MFDRKKLTTTRFFIVITVLAIVLGSLLYLNESDDPISPVSPLKMQVVDEEFDNLDGEGEIKWYEGFFTWNPQAQAMSYPFITGTVGIHWRDVDIMPVGIPYTSSVALIIELELRGTEVYTTKLEYDDLVIPESPGDGVFFNAVWTWINNTPGEYDEYIKAYWQIGDGREYIHLVDNGEIVDPSAGFKLYRENLIIPQLIYVPVVMKRSQ